MNHTPALAPSESLAGFAALLREHGLTVGVAEPVSYTHLTLPTICSV